MSKKRHSGPPPSIGWWPTVRFPGTEGLRWWDGTQWSFPCWRGDSLEQVAKSASWKSAGNFQVRWSARPKSWPARSRT